LTDADLKHVSVQNSIADEVGRTYPFSREASAFLDSFKVSR
jgi:hypothetical protein